MDLIEIILAWFRSWHVEAFDYPDDTGLAFPLAERAKFQEETYPWRYGECFVFRVPLTNHALAIGRYSGDRAGDVDMDGPMVEMTALEDWEFYVREEEDEAN